MEEAPLCRYPPFCVCGNKCGGIGEDSAMLSSGDIQVGLIM